MTGRGVKMPHGAVIEGGVRVNGFLTMKRRSSMRPFAEICLAIRPGLRNSHTTIQNLNKKHETPGACGAKDDHFCLLIQSYSFVHPPVKNCATLHRQSGGTPPPPYGTGSRPFDPPKSLIGGGPYRGGTFSHQIP